MWHPTALTYDPPVSKAVYSPAPNPSFKPEEQLGIKFKREGSVTGPPNSNTLSGPATHFSVLSFPISKIRRIVIAPT